MRSSLQSEDRMYIPLWGVTFMSNCEVTLLPSGASLVWALNVRLVFSVAVQKSLAWLSLFPALVFGVGAAAPALEFPLQLVPGCNEERMYVCLWGVTFMSDCEVTLLPSGASLLGCWVASHLLASPSRIPD